jgi:hypothetical protein
MAEEVLALLRRVRMGPPGSHLRPGPARAFGCTCGLSRQGRTCARDRRVALTVGPGLLALAAGPAGSHLRSGSAGHGRIALVASQVGQPGRSCGPAGAHLLAGPAGPGRVAHGPVRPDRSLSSRSDGAFGPDALAVRWLQLGAKHEAGGSEAGRMRKWNGQGIAAWRGSGIEDGMGCGVVGGRMRGAENVALRLAWGGGGG